MAEMALAAFGALGSAGSAIGATSMVGTVLQGASTVGSVLMQMSAARQQQASGQAAVQEASFNADMSRIETDSEANASAARAVELRREALRKIGAARVAFAGSGLDVSSGQLTGVERDLERQTSFGLEIERTNQALSRASGDARASQIELRGSNAMASAEARADADRMGALVTGAKGLLSIVKRG